MNRILFLTTFLAIFTVSSCSSFPGFGRGAAEEPPSPGVGTAPALPQGPGLETIAIVGTNDLHGTLLPLPFKTKEDEGTPPTNYQSGGVVWLAAAVDVLRHEHGSRLLWLDAGDEFQGSLESNSEQGAPITAFFNLEKISGAAVGNHEFDFGPLGSHGAVLPGNASQDPLGALKARMRESAYPFLSANLRDKATGESPELPNFRRSILLNAGSLKVGVIGLSTLDTPRTTRPQWIRGMEFAPLKESVLQEAKELRGAGADLVIATAHVGLKCEVGRVTPAHALRKPTDPLGECGAGDELVQLLHALPAGTLDGVVAGHSHQIVHHWVGGVPVIQGGSLGRYFNVLYLTYDRNQNKPRPELARIEGPIPVCPAVFSVQHDCNGDRKAPHGKRGDLVTPELHGKKLKADAAVAKLVEDVIARTAPVRDRVVGQAARRITVDRFDESELGNVVADALREFAHADVALVNSGALRNPLEAGPITYADVFRAIPFENSVATLTVTGQELKLLFRIAESGSRGYSAVSGVELRLIEPKSDAPSSDLDGNHRIEPWEIDRLLELRLADGSPVKADGEYKLATLDYLAYGGDDLAFFFKKINPSRIEILHDQVIRDVVAEALAKRSAAGPLNTIEHPLVDPAHRRLKFEKPAPPPKAKRKGRRRARKKKSA